MRSKEQEQEQEREEEGEQQEEQEEQEEGGTGGRRRRGRREEQGVGAGARAVAPRWHPYGSRKKRGAIDRVFLSLVFVGGLGPKPNLPLQLLPGRNIFSLLFFLFGVRDNSHPC